MKTKIEIGSAWFSNEGSFFIVDDVKEIDSKLWVFYHLHGSKKQYSCLAEAFLNRFSKNINFNY